MTKEELEKWIEDYERVVGMITAAAGEKRMVDMWAREGKVYARFLTGNRTGNRTETLSWIPEELLAQQPHGE